MLTVASLAEGSRADMTDSDMLLAIAEDASEVLASFVYVQDTIRVFGKLLVRSCFILRWNPGPRWWLIATPCMSDAPSEEKELKIDENNSRGFVAATTDSIEADRATLAEKEKHSAETAGALSKTEESQLANTEMLTSLDGLRQQARQEEMETMRR